MKLPAKRTTVLLALLAVLALIATACGGTKQAAKPRLIVGAIHVGSIKDAGYNEAEHDGLMAVKALPGVKVLEAENVPEGPDATRVIENMIAQGATLIFPQSFGYMDLALDLAKKYPNVKFEHPAGYKSADNFGTYWAASDQLHYALGVAAGLATKSNKIGFVGAMPIPQIIMSVNAFHLGARSVNPKVTTTVLFNGTWLDPGKEAAATNALADRGVDVIASLVDSPVTVVQTSEARGVWSIGYHSKAVASFAPKYWLSGVNFDWTSLFVKYANGVMDGTWKSSYDRPGLSTGVASLAPFGANVPGSVQTAVNAVVEKFKNGTLKSPLMGPVYDQAGKLQIKAGEVPNADLANTINWFAKGIVGQPK